MYHILSSVPSIQVSTCVVALLLIPCSPPLLDSPGRETRLGPVTPALSCWWDLLLGLSCTRSTVAEENSGTPGLLENSWISGREFDDSLEKEEKDLVRFTLGHNVGVDVGKSLIWLVVDSLPRLNSSEGRRECINSGLDSIEGKNRSQCSIRITMTWLQNLMSMMEATVSSLGRRRVGPKHTPRLEGVIRLVSWLADTLLSCLTSTFRISLLAGGSFLRTK